jgi:hypothetical protein
VGGNGTGGVSGGVVSGSGAGTGTSAGDGKANMPGMPAMPGMPGMKGPLGGDSPSGSSGGATGVVTCTAGVSGPIITDCGYPFASDNPRTSIVFNESDVLRAIAPSGGAPVASVRLFYNDEHALTLGVRQVVVKGASGTTSTDYPVSALPGVPSSVRSPETGTNATSGDESGLDPSGRPMWPVLFMTDTTLDANGRSGDWQEGGAPMNPTVVFGVWKAAVRSVDNTVSPPLVSITPDADPGKNNWDLGTGDAVPSDLLADKMANEGFGAEARWDLPLVPGHSYRIQIMVHDGDQNKTGGDVGEACVNFCADSSCPQGSVACGADGSCPIETESLCNNGCCL